MVFPIKTRVIWVLGIYYITYIKYILGKAKPWTILQARLGSSTVARSRVEHLRLNDGDGGNGDAKWGFYLL